MAVATPAKWVGHGASAADPRLIESVADYVALEQYPTMEDYKLGIGDRDGFYYKLTVDLDLGDTARNPLGKMVKTSDGKGGFVSTHTAITIKLDGDGHTITNGNWVGGANFYGGLISWLGAAGSVSNLHISSSSSSSSSGFYSGGFVGSNSSTITACSVTSSSSSGSYSGGFVGSNSSTVRNCFAACRVGTTGIRNGFCATVNGTPTFAYNFWDSDYNTTVSATETNATAVTTAQAKAGDTTPINGLSTATGAGYWYYQSGSYPRLFSFSTNIVVDIGAGLYNASGLPTDAYGTLNPSTFLFVGAIGAAGLTSEALGVWNTLINLDQAHSLASGSSVDMLGVKNPTIFLNLGESDADGSLIQAAGQWNQTLDLETAQAIAAGLDLESIGILNPTVHISPHSGEAGGYLVEITGTYVLHQPVPFRATGWIPSLNIFIEDNIENVNIAVTAGISINPITIESSIAKISMIHDPDDPV